MKTTEFLISFLQQKESKMTVESRALVTRGRADWDSLSIKEKKKLSRCGICKEKGHWFKGCPKNKAGETSAKPVEDKPQKNAVVFSLGNLGADIKAKWIVDSGATSHMSHRRD